MPPGSPGCAPVPACMVGRCRGRGVEELRGGGTLRPGVDGVTARAPWPMDAPTDDEDDADDSERLTDARPGLLGLLRREPVERMLAVDGMRRRSPAGSGGRLFSRSRREPAEPVPRAQERAAPGQPCVEPGHLEHHRDDAAPAPAVGIVRRLAAAFCGEPPVARGGGQVAARIQTHERGGLCRLAPPATERRLRNAFRRGRRLGRRVVR